MMRLGRHMRQRAPDARRHDLGFLDRHIGEVERAENDGLARQFFEHGTVEIGLRGFDRNLPDRRPRQLRQE